MFTKASHHPVCPSAVVCEQTVEELCDFIQSRCEANSRWFGRGRFTRHLPPQNEPLTVFHSGAVPPSPLFDLARAMFSSGACSAESLIIGFVLMGRYELMAGKPVTAHMMHRLYVACVQVGLKLHTDFFFNNEQFGAIVGVSLHELNQLEQALLSGLSWSVWVSAPTLAAVCGDFYALFDPTLQLPERTIAPRSEEMISPKAAQVRQVWGCCPPALPTPYIGPAEPMSPPTLSLCGDEDESDAYERAALLQPELSPSTTPPCSLSFGSLSISQWR